MRWDSILLFKMGIITNNNYSRKHYHLYQVISGSVFKPFHGLTRFIFTTTLWSKYSFRPHSQNMKLRYRELCNFLRVLQLEIGPEAHTQAVCPESAFKGSVLQCDWEKASDEEVASCPADRKTCCLWLRFFFFFGSLYKWFPGSLDPCLHLFIFLRCTLYMRNTHNSI